MKYKYIVRITICDTLQVLTFKKLNFKEAYESAKHVIEMGDMAVIMAI